MSAEHHDEQPTELTYPTTIRLVLASDDSDKENHTPDIRRDEITVKLEQPTTESLGGHSNEGAGGPTAIDYSDPLRIIIYLLQFLLCLIQVTLSYC
jgi:hypothetical protein